MSGYFARLVQQTGISFAETSNSGWDVPQSSAFSTEGNDVITPTPLEEEVLIDAQIEPFNSEFTVEEQSERPLENTENTLVSDTVSTQKTLPQVTTPEEKPNLEQPIQTVLNIEEIQPVANNLSLQPNTVVEVANQVVSSNNNENDNLLDSLPVNEEGENLFLSQRSNFPSVVEITEEISIAGEMQNPSIPITSQELKTKNKQENQEVTLPSALISEQGNTSEIQHTYLQAMWDWVTQTPETSVEAPKNIIETQFIASGEEQTSLEVEKIEEVSEFKIKHPQTKHPQSSQQSEVAEVQEFSLSIGSISLTIEAPTQEVPTVPVTQTKSQSPTKPDTQTSRLSRHYLKVR